MTRTKSLVTELEGH